MLNLRQIDNGDNTRPTDRFSNFTAPQLRAINSFFGNFGEPLEHGAFLGGEGEDQGLASEGLLEDESCGEQGTTPPSGYSTDYYTGLSVRGTEFEGK